MEHQLQAIVTVLALVNPVMCAAIFQQIEGNRGRRLQVADATRATASVVVILGLAALAGARILHLFGVSLDAFSVAGGGVLAWIGISMMRGSSSRAAQSKGTATANPSSLSPLILFAASPGTITGVVTLAVAHSRLGIPITALIAVGVVSAIMWLILLVVARRGEHSNPDGFIHDTVTRLMGLIVIAMGVQFALTGIKAFLAG